MYLDIVRSMRFPHEQRDRIAALLFRLSRISISAVFWTMMLTPNVVCLNKTMASRRLISQLLGS